MNVRWRDEFLKRKFIFTENVKTNCVARSSSEMADGVKIWERTTMVTASDSSEINFRQS